MIAQVDCGICRSIVPHTCGSHGSCMLSRGRASCHCAGWGPSVLRESHHWSTISTSMAAPNPTQTVSNTAMASPPDPGERTPTLARVNQAIQATAGSKQQVSDERMHGCLSHLHGRLVRAYPFPSHGGLDVGVAWHAHACVAGMHGRRLKQRTSGASEVHGSGAACFRGAWFRSCLALSHLRDVAIA